MEGADEETEGLSDRFSALESVQKTVGKGFDKLNAKAGFLGTALAFVKGMIMAVIGVLSLKAALIGGLVVGAIVGLALAWKENLGGMQDKAGEFKDLVMDEWAALKSWLNDFWDSIVAGVTASGVTMEDVGTLIESVLAGLATAFGVAWMMIRPVLSTLGDVLLVTARVSAQVFGTIIKWLARLEERFGVITWIMQVVGALIGVFVGALVIVKIVGAVIGVITILVSVFGSVISIIGTFIKIIAVVVKVAGILIGALNPISLVILAIIGVVALLAAAWTKNWFGIRDTIGEVADWMRDKLGGFVDWLEGIPSTIKDVFSDVAEMVTGTVSSAFNAAVPDTVSLPSVTLSAPDWAGGYSKTIGGHTLDLPQLDTGGMIDESGVAEVHEGEAVIPADIVQAAEDGEGGGGMTKIEINLGGIEIGDQSLDIQNMSHMELRKLAELISEQLGDEVRSVIT